MLYSELPPSEEGSHLRPGLGNDKVRGGCPGLGKSFKLISRTSQTIRVTEQMFN